MIEGGLEKLGKVLREEGLDYVCVPKGDRYFQEHVRPCDEKLWALTGFSGSAGCAILGEERGALFVDGRYTLQARRESGDLGIDILSWDEELVRKFLGEGVVLGVYGDVIPRKGGWMSYGGMGKWKGVELRVLEECVVERIWEERPVPFFGKHWKVECGSSVEERVARVREKVGDLGGKKTGLWISRADTICWLLGVRGEDVDEIPVVLSRGLLIFEGEDWDVKWYEEREGMRGVEEDVREVDVLRVDGRVTPESVMRRLEGTGVVIEECECVVRATQTVKSERELEGFRLCHGRDGVMMTKLLYEVEREGEGMTELMIVRRIEELRREREGYVRASFSSIVGSGEHGAIVHYRVSDETDRRLARGDVVLIDCGGHYGEGTTDVTRSVGIGEVGREKREAYTRVLKSHVMVSRQKFPKGTTGVQLDAIARSSLWNEGLDYGHGTGHGVGYVLDVHESPPTIAKRGVSVLEEGMVLSLEPGLYEEGEYGIRIENLAEVVKCEEGLCFAALTCVPYARELIEVDRLWEEERSWVDRYHEWVWLCLEGETWEEGERDWLWSMTRPLGGEVR